ncbi:MAG: winged helix-turn-helix domain-containing protein [Gammaproteobacteria bacterium]
MTPKTTRSYQFGPFRLDTAERLLFRGGQLVPLAPKALDLLLILIESAGHLKTREELTAALWPKTIVGEHNLTVHLSALRKVLGDDEEETPRYIQTARGHGYRFIAPITIEDATPGPADTQPVADGPRRRWRRIGGGVVMLVAIVVAAVLVWRLVLYAPNGRMASASVPAIAVLPFENLSADKGDVYFVDGIHDTILTKLAGIGSLRVASRAAAERYPSNPQDLKKVAGQLGVMAILEGSVQKAGNQVLINVRLIDVRTDDHIWAMTYARTLGNVIEAENAVAAQVAAALAAKLLPAEVARLARVPTNDPQAYDLFLKAEYYTDRVYDRDGRMDPVVALSQAAALYRQALARDPRFALA